MKVCYLILAHNNFAHLNRLIDALGNDNVSFCIHIDKKAEGFYVPTNNNANVIPDSYDIRWGGYSMIEASLSLLRYATNNIKDADYYILLSGVDYPIRPDQYLEDLLTAGKEYIDIAPMPMPYKPLERFEYYYFDYNRRNIKFYNPLFALEVLMKKMHLKRKIPFKLFVGSQWFALTRSCVQYILQTVDEDKKYADFFRHSLVPDESFFQTIIGNSPFAGNTATSLIYTDWEVPVPPALIEEKHITFLKNNDGFNTEYGYCRPYFARKFNDDSETVISEIEKVLRQ